VLDDTPNLPITIRLAAQDDHLDLARLAARSTAPKTSPPAASCSRKSTARWGGALSPDGSAIADPFHPTADVIDLMRAHAKHVGRPPRRRWLGLRDAAG